jgi:hypothetical protein
MTGSTVRVMGSLCVLGALLAAQAADAQNRGIQLSHNQIRVLVNKDVGDERWAIALNSTGGGTVLGNVFRPGGGEPVFLFCEPTVAPNTYTCAAAGPCDTTTCIEQYEDLGVVILPADFFLLPGAERPASAVDGAAIAAGDRGYQETPDGLHALVSKDVGNERWAITLNRDDRTVTGNVFFPEGGDPAFVSCNQALGSPTSFECFGAGPCVTQGCQNQYTPLGPVNLPADFFGPTTCGNGRVEGHERCEAGEACTALCGADLPCQGSPPFPIPGVCEEDCSLCKATIPSPG